MKTRYTYLPFLLLTFLPLLPGCSGKGKDDWGNRATTAVVDWKDYQYYWRAFGQLPANDKPAEWQYAMMLVVAKPELRDREIREDVYCLPFSSYNFTPESFSVEESICDFSTTASQKVLFYTDEMGNVRQLFVNHDKFDFFTKHSDGEAAHEDVVAFWDELQKYNSESTVFWKNPHTEFKRSLMPSH